MNKTFKNVFAKAKLENRSCFVGFVTGMDPDFNSSKKILKDMGYLNSKSTNFTINSGKLVINLINNYKK